MIDISQKCLFSDNTDNLNTIIEIALDGEKYKIAISDEYEDQASPSSIKKRIPERLKELDRARSELLSKLDEFKKLANELGFDLVSKNQTPNNVPNAISSTNVADHNVVDDVKVTKINDTQYKIQKNNRNINSDDGMTKEEVEKAFEAAKRASQSERNENSANGEAGVSLPGNAITIPQSVEVRTPSGVKSVEKPTIFTKKIQTVKGAAGIPTSIPKALQGSDGETTINIVNTGGDKTLQERTKNGGSNLSHYNNCSSCGGIGYRGKNFKCKSCNGVGVIY